MGIATLESIRQDLRDSTRAAHHAELVPFGTTTATELFEQAERFAEVLVEHAEDLSTHVNERGFATLFASLERVRRALEAAAATAFNAADERDMYHVDGHRSPQAFLQASVNLSNRERVERRQIADLVRLCPPVGPLLADGTLPVAHAVALGQLVANDRIARHRLLDAMTGFLLTANITPHDIFAKRVRDWGRLNDHDGSRLDAEASHRNRNVHLTNVLDAFVLEGRFGNIQGAKMHAILQRFVDIEFDRDWQHARQIHGDDTCVDHLQRSPGQRRADALEAIFLAATGHGSPRDVEIIINIVTDAHTFTDAATQAAEAAHAAHDNDVTDDGDDIVTGDVEVDTAVGETPDPSPSPKPRHRRRFCHTLDGVEIDPRAAVQAALTGHFRAVIVGDDGVIINQGRKQRLFRGNTRIAALLQAGLDNLHRCPYPGCRAQPRHIDHTTDWASPDAGPTDVANSNIPCAHHNQWKSKHGYTVQRDEHGNLHTYRPDGTELRPY